MKMRVFDTKYIKNRDDTISGELTATVSFCLADSRVERRCWLNFQCRGVLLVWMIGQGLICACSRCGCGIIGHFFLSSIFSLSFSLSLGDGPIQTEILSERAVKPKTTNQPIILSCCNPILVMQRSPSSSSITLSSSSYF